MIIEKPKGIVLSTSRICANVDEAKLRECREFGACYVDNGVIVEDRSITSYEIFMNLVAKLDDNAALLYVNLESADKLPNGLPDDLELEGNELQPMKVDDNLSFAIEGGLGYHIEEIRDDVIKPILDSCGVGIVKSKSFIWMIKAMLEGSKANALRQMVFMDNEGNFTWMKEYTSRYLYMGCEYSIYGRYSRNGLVHLGYGLANHFGNFE